MTIDSVDEANRLGKEWLGKEYNVNPDVIKGVSCIKAGNMWNVVLSFYSFTEPKKYLIVLSEDGKVLRTQEVSAYPKHESMGSAPTLLLVALIFSILTIVGFGFYFITILFFVISPIGPIGFGVLGFIPLVFLIVGVWVLSRISAIRSYTERGDAKSAYENDTVALGIVALIFNGIIPGILLLLAREDLATAAERSGERI
ncbi:MAG: hypothetical protein ACP5NK_04010 [Thermoplasmata archaeon]